MNKNGRICIKGKDHQPQLIALIFVCGITKKIQLVLSRSRTEEYLTFRLSLPSYIAYLVYIHPNILKMKSVNVVSVAYWEDFQKKLPAI
jgi:hypothetical protein